MDDEDAKVVEVAARVGAGRSAVVHGDSENVRGALPSLAVSEATPSSYLS